MYKSLALVIALFVLASVYFFGSPPKAPDNLIKTPATLTIEEKITSNEDLLALVANRSSMTLITERPVRMSREEMRPCAPPDLKPTPPRNHETLVTSRDVLLEILVTPPGAPAMKERSAIFPLDTVILKKKFSPSHEKSPELYTGMLKRPKGFNPECGDWEFFTISGDGKTVTSRGKLDKCMDCHKDYAASDFVTKSY